MLGPGSRIAHYTIRDRLGQGGMGTVYFATDTLIGRDVALKVVLAEPGLDSEARTELQRRLLREAQTAGVLSHANIITIFHAGLEDGTLFIAMELVHGCSLDRLAGRRRIPPWMAASVLGQAAAALDYAHGQGVLHRDVKPSNMLISTQGWVKLCDFGIARRLSVPSSTASFALIGSPAYMSPEQGLNTRVGPAADQYSLAVVAYEVLSGTQPFHADNIYALLNCHLAQPPPVGPLERAGLPEQAIRALLRGLDKDPDERYPSCGAFIADLFAAWPEATQPAAARGSADNVTVICPCPACRETGVQLSPSSPAGIPPATPVPQATRPVNARTARGAAGHHDDCAASPPLPRFGPSARARGLLRRHGAAAGLAAFLVLAGILSYAGLRSLLLSDRRAARAGAAQESAPPAAIFENLPSPSMAGSQPDRKESTAGESRQAGEASRPAPSAAGSAATESSAFPEKAESDKRDGTPLASLPLQRHAPWPTHGGNHARSGIVDAEGLRQAALAWSVRLPADPVAGPVIDRDGRVFVAMADGTVAAVEGSRIAWAVSLAEPSAGGLDVVEGGLVRVWLRNGQVAALTASEGALIRIEEGHQQWREAAMDPARRMFFVSGRWLRCTGLPGWGLALAEEAAGAPVVDDAAGVAVVCTRNGNVYAVNGGGGLEWSLQLPGRLSAKPAALPGGGVIVGAVDGGLYLIRSGEVLWKQMLQAPIRGAPAISRDGLIHAPAGSGCLYGLDSGGRLLWRHCLGNEIRSGPAMDDRGRLYILTAARKLECLIDSRSSGRPML